MQETQVQSLGQEDLLEEALTTHTSILAWRIPWMGSLAGCDLWSPKELDMTEATEQAQMQLGSKNQALKYFDLPPL